MLRSRFLCAGLLVLVLSACAGCTTPSAPPLANTTAPAHKAKATIRITIPKQKHRRILVRGHYISPATQSITIAVTPSSGPVVNYNADLTPATNDQCTVSIVSSLICTITLSLSPGTYTATFATYDGLLQGGNGQSNLPSGNVLSSSQNVSLNVVAGHANQINVSLGGVPTSLLLAPLASSLHGDAGSGYFLPSCFTGGQVQVLGLDADNNVIVGPGAPVPTLTSGDPAHLAILATPSPSSPNTFTLSRATNPVVGSVVQLTAGVTPALSSGATAVTQNINVTFSNTICDVYVTDSVSYRQRIDAITAVYGSFPASPISTGVASLAYAAGITLDASGNLYATNPEQTNNVTEFLAVGGVIPASPASIVLGSGFSYPNGVAVDASGDVFVADTGDNTVNEMIAVNGSIPASPTIRTLGSFNGPLGVAVDPSGNVYVSEASNHDVKEMLAVGGSIPASPTINTLLSGINPYGIAPR